MSTTYNRRRGASARKMRKPRVCARAILRLDGMNAGEETDGVSWQRCVALAPVNRYCSQHQLGR